MKAKLKIESKVLTSKLAGDVTDLRGDVTDLRGNITNLCGDVTGLTGDVSGLSGNATGLRGNVDACELTEAERAAGVYVSTLVEKI